MAKQSAAGDGMSRVNNPFLGLSLAAMKKKWSSMTPAQRKSNVENFRRAAKVSPKIKKAIKGTSKKAAPSKPKADGSVKAIPRKTKYTRDVEARNKAENAKRKSNFDGVGPTPSQRRKQSSPKAMSQPKEGSYKTVKGQKFIYKQGKWRKIGKYSMDQKG